MIFRYPVNYIGITSLFGNRTYTNSNGIDVTSFHAGLDLGWKEFYQDPIYAIENGTVIYVGQNDPSAGNFIVISHSDSSNTWISRYLHLSSISVSTNQTVSKGQQIGVMGATGDVSGAHLHYELWRCPLGYVYKFADQKTYAVDPINYTFAYPDQEISTRSNYSYLVKRLEDLNYSERQLPEGSTLTVLSPDVRFRTEPSTRLGSLSIAGIISLGTYQAVGVTNEVIDGYVWAHIKYNDSLYWVAVMSNDTTLFEATKPTPEPSPSPTPQPQPNPEIEQYKKIFTATKTDTYYIKLQEGQSLYKKES